MLRTLLPNTGPIHYSSIPKHPSNSDYFKKIKKKNRFEDLESTGVELTACGTPGVN